MPGVILWRKRLWINVLCQKNAWGNIYKCKHFVGKLFEGKRVSAPLIFVCMLVCFDFPIIIQKPFDRFASMFIWNSVESRECTSLGPITNLQTSSNCKDIGIRNFDLIFDFLY